MRKSTLLVCAILVCASIFTIEAQTFEWESAPEGFGCDVQFIKIEETLKRDFFITGYDDCKISCLQLNKYGNLQWKTTPTIFSTGLTDFISLDGNSYYVIGMGKAFPERSVFFKINENGLVNFEKEFTTRTYHPLYFYDKLYHNQFLTYGTDFINFPDEDPIVEFRNLAGDTLAKKVVKIEENAGTKKIFPLKKQCGFLLFCSPAEGGFSFITILETDSLWNIIREKVFGKGNNGYQSQYHDVIEKDSSYYLLANLSFYSFRDTKKRGSYIFQFNHDGDSVNLTRIDENISNLKSIAPTRDNGFIVAGKYLMKLDSNYKIEWRRDFKKWVIITSVSQAADGGYYGIGSYYDETIDRNKMYVFKTDAKGNIDASANYPGILIYPNPVKDLLNLDLPYGEEFTISLLDLEGRKCLDYTSTGSSLINVGILKQGIYMLLISDKAGNIVKKHKLLKLD